MFGSGSSDLPKTPVGSDEEAANWLGSSQPTSSPASLHHSEEDVPDWLKSPAQVAPPPVSADRLSLPRVASRSPSPKSSGENHFARTISQTSLAVISLLPDTPPEADEAARDLIAQSSPHITTPPASDDEIADIFASNTHPSATAVGECERIESDTVTISSSSALPKTPLGSDEEADALFRPPTPPKSDEEADALFAPSSSSAAPPKTPPGSDEEANALFAPSSSPPRTPPGSDEEASALFN